MLTILMRRATGWMRAALLSLAACGSGSPSAPRSAPDRLQILDLQAPDTVGLSRRFLVRVRVADGVGVDSVELRFGAERRLLPMDGKRSGALSTEFIPTVRGVFAIEAVATGVDGARGAAASTVVVVGEEEPAPDALLTRAELSQRISEWNRRGYQSDEPYARGPLYRAASPQAAFVPIEDWWMHWLEEGGPQPFDSANHCDGVTTITPNGEVLRCWLQQNPIVGVSLLWEELLPNGNVQSDWYPSWPESRKHDLDVAFYEVYTWLESGLQTPFPIPADPSPNMIPPTSWGSQVGLTEANAWALYVRTIAHCLALEIGGFVPWSFLNYDLSDLGQLLHSKRMFWPEERTYEGVTYVGYWPVIVHAFPKTAFQFFVDQDIVRSTHLATIRRLIAWSGDHLRHYANYNGDTVGKTPMEVAHMHWQYYGGGPVQRILAGTLRDNTTEPASWTQGCWGTSLMYVSILRALNIPAGTQFGWGLEDGEPHLDGHTVPVFVSIGKTLSHGDDVLGWNFFLQKVSPPPATVSSSKLLISWDTFVDWFYDHPDANVGRQRSYEIPLEVLPDEVLDLYCSDLENGLSPSQGSVRARFSEHYSFAELVLKDLWLRLAAKEAALDYCD